MSRLPPALAASATPRILEELGEPPARVLELGFAGIHAPLLRLAASRSSSSSPTRRIATARASGRASALAEPPPESFDAVVAPDGADLAGVTARKRVLVGQDGSVWSSA